MKVFLTASRAYGMYDSEYQVIARDCIIMNTKARTALCSCNKIGHDVCVEFDERKLTKSAASRVKMKETTTRIVAIALVEANIFLIWLTGPIKKHVLAIDKILPRV
jgi:hypothetical protein